MRFWLVALVAMFGVGAPAYGRELAPAEVSTAGVVEHVGRRIPLDAAFVDEDGMPVTLGTYFADTPVIVSLNYFHCQYVCPIEEDGLISALNGVRLSLGRDFTLLTVSIDPRDGPTDATTVKARALRGYDRPAGADGWHLLTGDAFNIQRLTDALGYQYVADQQQGDFAHPIGVFVLTPDGRTRQFLNGLDFAAGDLTRALTDASQVTEGALVICYRYDPLNGRYASFALNLVRLGGGLGFAALLVWLATLWRADLKRTRA